MLALVKLWVFSVICCGLRDGLRGGLDRAAGILPVGGPIFKFVVLILATQTAFYVVRLEFGLLFFFEPSERMVVF
jgi:hypothetical protein